MLGDNSTEPFQETNVIRKKIIFLFLVPILKLTLISLIQPDFTIDVWLDKEKPLSQGKSLNEAPEGRVCVILGGGNVNVIPPFDTIHKMFVENQVVMMKYNPVNANIGFWIDKLFQELIDDGFYASTGGNKNNC